MMKSYLSEEDKLKLTIKKNYLERDAIKTKILNYLNRLSHLCSDEQGELNRRERQKRGFFEENLEDFPEFRVEKRPKLEEDERTVTRNRRLLQVGLFEHLKKAKDALEQEKSNETVIRQQMQNKRVEQKLQEEKKEFEKYQLEDIEKKIITHMKEIKNADSHIKIDEAKLMKLSLINHYEKMKNFISTNCQPTIFWCPFKFNSKTEMLQKETDNFIRKKIDAIKESNYEVDFEEEPWVRQFQNLKEIVRRRNRGEGEATVAQNAVNHADRAEQEVKEDENDEKDVENEKDDEKENDEENEKYVENEENEEKENDEENEKYVENEDNEDNGKDVENEEDEENIVETKSPNGSHYTDEEEQDTQGTPKKSTSNDSDVNTLQKGNTCPAGDSIGRDEFYPGSTGQEDSKCREASEANEAHSGDEAGERNDTNETIELDKANEHNEANITNETNETIELEEVHEANVTNETNETIGDNDAPGEHAHPVQKKAGKKKRGRPKKKGR
ncbi:hypothetical protein AK88_00174 [Plasmodium fragile]|uniref:Pinin/SDK/MemA protein domain-containing protein n=1 Tax=Plasmodium fragile TaxID=5857 RepID=A0A0D9QSD4_PLAFR|nr:uncharacterized protein AK88_00174 [Plasmodium fragile]KJP90005.1 hypothetical protein AK88_00174 [Plasmodium fragile]